MDEKLYTQEEMDDAVDEAYARGLTTGEAGYEGY